MKDNVEVTYFHIKSSGVQGPAFVQITFERCTTSFYFEKRQSWYKNDNCQLAALICMKRFRMFTHFKQPRFQ